MTTSPDYDGPVYVGAEGDEPELVDADVDPGPVPAAGEREEPVVPPVDWALAAYLGDNEDEGYPHPAPPVVHPEPGDRADEEWVWIQATREGWSLTDDNAPEEMRLAQLSGYLRQFAREARAAAVAAVRADLVAQVEALRANALDSDDRRDLGWNQAMNRAAALVRGPAAAVRSATKEES